MSTSDLTTRLQEAESDWEERTLKPTLERAPERKQSFTTTSLTPVERLYTPNSIPDFDYQTELGFPGQPPYTRGIHATGHRGRLWTMRQFAGFGSAFDTNKRFKYLLEHGQTGLSTAFDLPTLMGYDSDHPFSEGEVGKCGVAISSLADMEVLFDGIPLEQGHDVDDDQRTGIDDTGDVPGRRRKAGRRLEEAWRDASKRYSQGVHRAERVDLSSATGYAADRGHDRVLH